MTGPTVASGAQEAVLTVPSTPGSAPAASCRSRRRWAWTGRHTRTSFAHVNSSKILLMMVLATCAMLGLLSSAADQGTRQAEGFSVRRVLKERGPQSVAMTELIRDLNSGRLVQISHNVSTNIILDARSVVRGSIRDDPGTGDRFLELTLNKDGIRLLAKAAESEPGGLIAVVLDGEVYATIRLHGPVPKGIVPIRLSVSDPSGERIMARAVMSKATN